MMVEGTLIKIYNSQDRETTHRWGKIKLPDGTILEFGKYHLDPDFRAAKNLDDSTVDTMKEWIGVPVEFKLEGNDIAVSSLRVLT